jgi:hypothetical protein
MELKNDEEVAESENYVDKKSPKAMPFILLNIFAERYCSAGISGLARTFLNSAVREILSFDFFCFCYQLFWRCTST